MNRKEEVSRLQVEIRADKKRMSVRGYVNVVGRDSRVMHDKTGPYIEQIMPGAFAKSLAAGGPVELRFDHQRTLGSTENKDELELREDNIGLLASAVVTDSEVIAAADREELRGWSFGFVKKKDHWKTDENGTRRRFVDELELREVSILDKTSVIPPLLLSHPAFFFLGEGVRRLCIQFRNDPPSQTEACRKAGEGCFVS